MSKPSTTPATAAISAHGPARLLGPLLLLALAALPATWWLPLFVARVPFLWREQVTVVSGLAALWDLDRLLFAIVLLCSVIAPMTKLVATLHVWYRAPLGTAPKALGRLALLGKLSMTELFLLAVVIVGFKGVGLGRIEVAWGLEAFAAVVVLSFALSLWVEAAVRRLARRPDAG
jgi:paraquat-inducible protein A